jgi:heptosyltransferase III
LRKTKKILIVIQRSNGDVFLSGDLINSIYDDYSNPPQIDLLVNDDTYQIAKLLPNINIIHTFSYQKKKDQRLNQEIKLFKRLFRKYDLSINLTSSDRSVIYALLAAKNSISIIEKDNKKSWWKKKLLGDYYYYDDTKHIHTQNLTPLNLLQIKHKIVQKLPHIPEKILFNLKTKLKNKKIKNFIIFHPSAQYKYKIYPEAHRNKLLSYLNTLGVAVIVTGANNEIDLKIKNQLPSLANVYDFIGETSIEEYFSLCKLSLAYIGMDTLNMHIAARLNKRIFAIFGPTNLKMWSPWSIELQTSASHDMPIQTYGNITIFQAQMKCVACGQKGCNNNGKSECLTNINPKIVFEEVSNWYKNV